MLGIGLQIQTQITNAYVASVNLLNNPKVEDGNGWSDSGSTSVNTVNGALITSGGASWHRLFNGNPTILSPGTYTFSAWYIEGTSGVFRLTVRNTYSATETTVQGSSGALSMRSVLVGSNFLVENQDLGNNTYKVLVTITFNAEVRIQLGVGPGSAVLGENVTAIKGEIVRLN